MLWRGRRTLDEAIRHAGHEAAWNPGTGYGEDNKQLEEWLSELKQLRETDTSTNNWVELIRSGHMTREMLDRIADQIKDPVVVQYILERYPDLADSFRVEMVGKATTSAPKGPEAGFFARRSGDRAFEVKGLLTVNGEVQHEPFEVHVLYPGESLEPLSGSPVRVTLERVSEGALDDTVAELVF